MLRPKPTLSLLISMVDSTPGLIGAVAGSAGGSTVRSEQTAGNGCDPVTGNTPRRHTVKRAHSVSYYYNYVLIYKAVSKLGKRFCVTEQVRLVT